MLDAIDSTDPNPLAPVRLPIVDKWRDMGTIVMGKIESGFMRQGDVYLLMPAKYVRLWVWVGVWVWVWVCGYMCMWCLVGVLRVQ